MDKLNKKTKDSNVYDIEENLSDVEEKSRPIKRKNSDSSDNSFNNYDKTINNDLEYEINSEFNISYFVSSNFIENKYIFHLNKDEHTNNSTSLLPESYTKLQEVMWNFSLNEFQIHYKAYKNIPKCLLNPLRKNGAIRTKSFFKGNIIWKLMKYDRMSKLIPKLNYYQRFNHFPCTWQLGRKDNMATNFQRFHNTFPTDYKYVPETFVMPRDREAFLKKSQDDKGKKWILKPVASSRGRGIRLITCEDKIPQKCLISSYVDNPHIINGKKYDLRLYVVITNFSPLKLYLYNEGLTRFASEDYNLNDEEYNKFMHLTNYSINKTSSKVDNKISNDNEVLGIKWSLSSLKNYFKEKNLDYAALEKKIRDVIVKTILTITDTSIEEVKKLTTLPNCLFELYGFDILIDDNLEPWLMEVNLNPSLDCQAQMDNKIKSNLITDIINLLAVTPYSRSKENKFKKFPKVLAEGSNLDFLNLQGKEYNLDFTNEDKYIDHLVGLSECDDLEEYRESLNQRTYNKWETDIILYAENEFSRKGDFELLFPKSESVDYYSKFITNPGKENILLWNWVKDKKKDKLYLSKYTNFDFSRQYFNK